jgi:Plavaka transposase
MKFDVWKRPLWSYCEELLGNPAIVKEFHWHAEQRFHHDGTSFVRFIDEPYTANAWWRIQVSHVHTLCLWFLMTLHITSRSFRQALFQCAFRFMPTRTNFQRWGPRKAIWSMYVVPTFPLICAMARDLLVVELLAGCPLYVCYLTPSSSLCF